MGSCCCASGKDEKKDKNHKNDKKGPTASPTPHKTPTLHKSAPEEKSNESKEGSTKGTDHSTGIVQKLFKSDNDETDSDQKKVIEDERLERELKQAIKGGDSAYGKVKAGRKEHKKKGLSASNYNQSGLVDKQSKEFSIVGDYLGPKNYQLMESIGSGNYAEVYKAFMADKNRYVAVKVIDLTKANDNYRKAFLPREINILRQLHHPGVIKTYEVAQTVNRIFMIMEYCANGTVTDWLRDKGSFTEATAWEMCRRIVDALNYMHGLKIAHRDLKLENILINDKFYPKISDFSYSVVVDEKEMSSTTFCGSLPYFAPEILQRKAHNPFASDVWGLGVCFYVMVCDGLPFRIDDEKQMLNKQLEKDWDFKKRVQNKLSSHLKNMITKMLEPDVSKRVTMAQLMNEPWIKNQPKPTE